MRLDKWECVIFFFYTRESGKVGERLKGVFFYTNDGNLGFNKNKNRHDVRAEGSVWTKMERMMQSKETLDVRGFF